MPRNLNPSRLRLAPAMQARLTEVDRLEPRMEDLGDAEPRRKTDELRDRLHGGKSSSEHFFNRASNPN